MDRKPRNLGRAYLIAQLRKRGLSRRQAVGILNFILHEMSMTLRRGGEVEFPFGKLRRVRHRLNQWWNSLDKRQPWTVAWELDEAGDRLLNGYEGNHPEAAPAGSGGRKRPRRRPEWGRKSGQ